MNAEEYLAVMSARKSDRDARLAFRNVALQLLGSGGSVFDFGAGPGLDARFYAERGFRVYAYDNDPQMREAFSRYCGAEIRQGKVVLYQGSYADFLGSLDGGTSTATPPVDLVTSNFAPLNLIGDPHALFRALHGISAAHGRMLASVLNPRFIGDMRYGWWWANRIRYRKHGKFAVPGASGDIWRRSSANFAAAAAPYFRLRSVLRGLPRRSGALQPAGQLALSTSRYMFLLFERQ